MRRLVVLGLREEVRGEPFRIGFIVGDHHDLRRACDGVDADRAEDLALGLRDIGVAGADDLRDRLNRLGAVGERRDSLRASDAVNLADASQMRRRQHRLVDLAIGRRRDHHDPRDAGNPGGNGVHQHRAWIACLAARNVETDRVQRGPAMASSAPMASV